MAVKKTLSLNAPTQAVTLPNGSTRTIQGQTPSPTALGTTTPQITSKGPQTLTPSTAVTQAPVGSGKNGLVSGPYDSLRTAYPDLLQQGVPQSFIDRYVNRANAAAYDGNFPGGVNPASGVRPQDQEAFRQQILGEWSRESKESREDFVGQDTSAVEGANTATDTKNATTLTNNIVKNQVAGNTDYWNKNVDPALTKVPQAQAAQVTGNRASEAALSQLTNQYTGTVNQNQALRMEDIGKTNAAGQQFVSQLGTATNNTNNSNQQLASQLQGAAASTNQANSALASQLQGAASSTNANQSAALGQLLNQNNASNSQQQQYLGTLTNANNASSARQNQNLSTYQNQNEDSNVQQMDAVNDLLQRNKNANQSQNLNAHNITQQNVNSNNDQTATFSAFKQDFDKLNETDQQNYLRYMQETNPQMATLLAQGSDPTLTGNQGDALGRWKELSTPQVTAQEQLLAELARRKFESGDRSSREAVMSQLAGRGLQSGGLVIAGQQAEQQQLGQDRVLAQMGMQASAVQRGMVGLQGYTDTANTLRNADDQVRQFQDTYKQNEALRTSNLAQNRANTGLATTNQQGQRSADVYTAGTETTDKNAARNLVSYNANTQTVENNSARDLTGYNAQNQSIGNNANRNQLSYNAGTETVQNNAARDQSNYNAGTETVNNNAGRNLTSFNANTVTNDANFGRTNTAVTNNQAVNQSNFGNTSQAVTNSQAVNQANLGNTQQYTSTGLGELSAGSTRYSNGLAAGDTTAGNVFAAGQVPITARTNNLQQEFGNSVTGANTALAGQGAYQGMTGTNASAQQAAIDQILGRNSKNKALTAAEKLAEEN